MHWQKCSNHLWMFSVYSIGIHVMSRLNDCETTDLVIYVLIMLSPKCINQNKEKHSINHQCFSAPPTCANGRDGGGGGSGNEPQTISLPVTRGDLIITASDYTKNKHIHRNSFEFSSNVMCLFRLLLIPQRQKTLRQMVPAPILCQPRLNMLWLRLHCVN